MLRVFNFKTKTKTRAIAHIFKHAKQQQSVQGFMELASLQTQSCYATLPGGDHARRFACRKDRTSPIMYGVLVLLYLYSCSQSQYKKQTSKHNDSLTITLQYGTLADIRQHRLKLLKNDELIATESA